MALCAEFLGSMLFSFTGSALLSVALADADNPNVVMAALGNAAGITVAGNLSTWTSSHANPTASCICRSCLLQLLSKAKYCHMP